MHYIFHKKQNNSYYFIRIYFIWMYFIQMYFMHKVKSIPNDQEALDLVAGTAKLFFKVYCHEQEGLSGHRKSRMKKEPELCD